MRNLEDRRRRWGIVLAGGDGVRLRPLTRFICGDDRPKQFCRLYAGTTLLEQARSRAERSIPAGQILFSLTRAHETFYLEALSDCPAQRIVQPRNRGTAAAILSAMLLIARNDHDATVAVFPSDHHYSDEDVISEAVEKAFALSRCRQDAVIVVGAQPSGPEIDYGWIEVGEPVAGPRGSFLVRGFHEKPQLPLAQTLLEKGALWNTFVMVGKAVAFLEMTCSALPGMLAIIRQQALHLKRNQELRIPDPFYARVPHADFSRQVLSFETERLIVQRLEAATWSDLGDCERAVSALSCCAAEPEWAPFWRTRNTPGFVQPAAAVARA